MFENPLFFQNWHFLCVFCGFESSFAISVIVKTAFFFKLLKLEFTVTSVHWRRGDKNKYPAGNLQAIARSIITQEWKKRKIETEKIIRFLPIH